MDDQQIEVLGRRWQLIFGGGLPNDADGLCDDPDARNKRIRIRRSLRGEYRLEVLLHEILGHAADWSKDEEWVEKMAHDGARILYRKLGYRAPDDHA